MWRSIGKVSLVLGVLGVLASGAVCAQASALPPPVFGAAQGVQIKEWSVTDRELEMMKAAGLSFVRFPMPWYAVEKNKGRFDWRVFDGVVERLHDHGLKAVIILGAGHPAYTGVAEQQHEDGTLEETYPAPVTPEEIDAFAAYVRAAAAHFDGNGVVWELWNEPDSRLFWYPKPDGAAYVAMAVPACRAIKEAVPDSVVMGPGMAAMAGGDDAAASAFLGQVLKSPLASCLDAVSLHPYRDRAVPPELVLEAYAKTRAFIEAHTPDGMEPLPLVASEWGFSTAEVSSDAQADYALRSFLLNVMDDVPLSIWYEWYDSLTGGADPEAHFGLIDHDKKPKVAYEVLASFLPALTGCVFEARIALPDPLDYLVVFRREDGSGAVVYWTARPQTELSVQVAMGDSNEKKTLTLRNRPQMKPLVVDEMVALAGGEGGAE